MLNILYVKTCFEKYKRSDETVKMQSSRVCAAIDKVTIMFATIQRMNSL